MVSPLNNCCKLHLTFFANMKKFTAYFIFAFILTIMAATSFAQNNQPDKPVLNHIALYVVDLQSSTDFYRNIIGLDTIPEPFHDGKHVWFSIGIKSHLHLIQGAAIAALHPKNTHLCFSVNSIDVFINKLQKNNIGYENWAGEASAITIRTDGVKQIYFKDPDGYWIEINDAKE
jgi:lactoylglutathione lyase